MQIVFSGTMYAYPSDVPSDTAELTISSGALPEKTNEAFAQSIALGTDPAEACRKIFRFRGAAAARAKGEDLLREPSITSRIATLQRHASHIAEHQHHFTRADLIAFLVETIQSPVSSIDQHHRQCQEWTRDELTTSGRRANPTAQQKTQTPPSKNTAKGRAASKANIPRSGTDTAATITNRAAESTTPEPSSAVDVPAAPILLRSKTKLPSKLDAAKLLATLCGWNAPSKVESNVHLAIDPTIEQALSRLLK